MKAESSILALFLGALVGAQAQSVFNWSSGFANDGKVPSDGESWYDKRTLDSIPGIVVGVEVRIHLTEDLEEGNNGDLYAYLSHGGQTLVLLNRVGRDAQNEGGYLDAGFNITLSDSAMTDVHFYGGNNGNLVTGIYQPDGRNIDPTSAGAIFVTTPRQNNGNPLALFDGMNPNGDWVLHISDHGTVGTSTVKSWGMTILVPEPAQIVMASAILCCLAALARQIRRRPSPSPEIAPFEQPKTPST